jgi:hypothetical protein
MHSSAVTLTVGLAVPFGRPLVSPFSAATVAFIILVIAFTRTTAEYLDRRRGVDFYFHLPWITT